MESVYLLLSQRNVISFNISPIFLSFSERAFSGSMYCSWVCWGMGGEVFCIICVVCTGTDCTGVWTGFGLGAGTGFGASGESGFCSVGFGFRTICDGGGVLGALGDG